MGLRSWLSDKYTHKVIDHAIEYVRDDIHTNDIENFWTLLKRALRGTYVHVNPGHLDRYVDEQSLRFNECEDTDSGQFKTVIGASSWPSHYLRQPYRIPEALMSAFHIRHITHALDALFGDLIDMRDYDGKTEDQRLAAFRSRALAAMCIKSLARTDAHEAASSSDKFS